MLQQAMVLDQIKILLIAFKIFQQKREKKIEKKTSCSTNKKIFLNRIWFFPILIRKT